MNDSIKIDPDCFYWDGTNEVGPFPQSTLDRLRKTGLINDQTLVRAADDPDWRALAEMRPLQPHGGAANEKDPVPPDIAPTAEGAPRMKGAAEFAVEFGSSFMPSSGGFQGTGVLAIGEDEIEFRGGFAFPYLVEILGIIVLVGALVALPGKMPVWVLIVAVFAARFLIASIPNSRRMNRTSVRVASRNGNVITLRWTDEKGGKIVLRASDEEMAKAIEEKVRS